jgi:hypothetical protein
VVLDVLALLLDGREAMLAGDWNQAINFPKDDDPGASAFFPEHAPLATSR